MWKLRLFWLGLALIVGGGTSCLMAQSGSGVHEASRDLREDLVPFALSLDAISLPDLPGLQSYVWARDGDTWLIFGGRLDGLHRRQPWASFDLDGHNRRMYAVDISSGAVWSRSVADLPPQIAAQFSATNACFLQRGDQLFVAGGYGYSPAAQDHITHPSLSVLDLPGVIAAVKNPQQPLSAHVRHLRDEQFAVTGGQLAELHGIFLLVGGQRFDGRYNPMGHGTFVQTYTDAVRRFRLSDQGGKLSVQHLSPFEDEKLFHRRDYNLMPQIRADGQAGFVAYSGVFRPDFDQPFMNIVDLDTSSWSERAGFTQYLNHYHCARLAFYQPALRSMHHVFFGGIAQFTLNADGSLIQDTDVPFVRTIARVSRGADGQTAEYQLPISMPQLLGAGAEFIPANGVMMAGPGILDLDAMLPRSQADSVLIGYIFGGIHSPRPNVFWVEDGTLSKADSRIFRVWLKRPAPGQRDQFNPASVQGFSHQIHPGSDDGNMALSLELDRESEVSFRVFSAEGSLIAQRDLGLLPAGRHAESLPVIADGSLLFIVELQAGAATTVQVVKAEF